MLTRLFYAGQMKEVKICGCVCVGAWGGKTEKGEKEKTQERNGGKSHLIYHLWNKFIHQVWKLWIWLCMDMRRGDL